MTICLIAAMAENRVIGRDNSLPWNIPEELAMFHRLTMGKPVIMGRKTHDSIGRALSGRDNIVLSRNPAYVAAEGCMVVPSLDRALELTKDAPEICIIGGETLYRQALPLADRIHLTTIALQPEGDSCFPAFETGFDVTDTKEFAGPPRYMVRTYVPCLR